MRLDGEEQTLDLGKQSKSLEIVYGYTCALHGSMSVEIQRSDVWTGGI